MIAQNNLIKLPKNLNCKNFDDHFLNDINIFLNSAPCHFSKITFDLTGTTWMDLLEAACLPIIAEWIEKETKGVCKPGFLFCFPRKTDKASEAQESTAKKSKSIYSHVKKINDFYFHFLSWWRLLDILLESKFQIGGLIDGEKHLSYNEINEFLKMEDYQIPSEFRGYINWLKKEWRKESEIRQIGGSLRLLPLTPIQNKNTTSTFVSSLKKRLEKLNWMSKDQRGIMCDSIIYELCDNIIDHAYRPTDPFPKTSLIAVRLLADPTGEGEIINKRINAKRVKKLITYRIKSSPKRYEDFFVQNRYSGFFEIVVADGGQGFWSTLGSLFEQERGHKATESEIIDYAFSEGVSQRKKIHPTAGKSLSLLKGRVMNWGKSREEIPGWGGLLEVRSFHGRITYLPGRDPIRSDNLFKLPGVQYRILLPTRTQESQLKRKQAINELNLQYPLFG
jgi:hypothetical protein